MRIFIKFILSGVAICLLLVGSFFVWLNTSKAEKGDENAAVSEEIQWGVDFSESQAEYLGLDSRETYSAIVHDLGAKNIKIHINWESIEGLKGAYTFDELDWQVKEAERNNVKLILVVGMKTGRWPECHEPGWLQNVPADQQQEEILAYVRTVVARYKDSDAISYWQIENEPVIRFGKCPKWYYADSQGLLKAEYDAVKSLDSSRQIIISDSGELSTWTDVAKIADVVGITMYRDSWKPGFDTFGINPYAFLSPEIYANKAALIGKLYGKPVICIELQAEPWASKPLAEASLSEQAKSMNGAMFDENVAFAKATGLKGFYFWGVEWWYWMKVKHDQPEIWDKAKVLFAE